MVVGNEEAVWFSFQLYERRVYTSQQQHEAWFENQKLCLNDALFPIIHRAEYLEDVHEQSEVVGD